MMTFRGSFKSRVPFSLTTAATCSVWFRLLSSDVSHSADENRRRPATVKSLVRSFVRSYNTTTSLATSKSALSLSSAQPPQLSCRPFQDETPLKAWSAYDVLVIIGWLGYGEMQRLHTSSVTFLKTRRSRIGKRGGGRGGKARKQHFKASFDAKKLWTTSEATRQTSALQSCKARRSASSSGGTGRTRRGKRCPPGGRLDCGTRWCLRLYLQRNILVPQLRSWWW